MKNIFRKLYEEYYRDQQIKAQACIDELIFVISAWILFVLIGCWVGWL